MSSERETIIASLAAVGINKTVEEVIVDFSNSDTLAPYLMESENTEAVIQAHLPEYIQLLGVVPGAAPAMDPVDPTQTQSGVADAPAHPANVTDAQRAAIIDAQRANAHAKEIVSVQSEITAVLIDKPYPGEYMANVGRLHVKGEVDAVVKQMKERYNPEVPVSVLIAKGEAFIPSNAQMAELRELHKTDNQTSKVVPAWFDPDFNNDERYNAILNTLTSGDGMFPVLVAPKEDTGEGASKVKAWRWNTKGVAINVPATASGETNFTERNFSKDRLKSFLMIDANGFVVKNPKNQLAAKVVKSVQKKTSGSMTGSAAVHVIARILGNNPANNPELRVINKFGNGKGKMTQRSTDFYFVAVVKDGKPIVRKQRLPLLWEDAPIFELKPEYAETFPNAKGGANEGMTEKMLQEISNTVTLGLEEILSKGDVAWQVSGAGDFFRGIEESAQKKTMAAAADLAI